MPAQGLPVHTDGMLLPVILSAFPPSPLGFPDGPGGFPLGNRPACLQLAQKKNGQKSAAILQPAERDFLHAT